MNSYYSRNLKEDEIKAVDEILLKENISILNTRIVKKIDNYIVLIPAIEDNKKDLNDPNLKVTL